MNIQHLSNIDMGRQKRHLQAHMGEEDREGRLQEVQERAEDTVPEPRPSAKKRKTGVLRMIRALVMPCCVQLASPRQV